MTDELPELMSRYVRGDAAAFRELYARVAGPLLGYLMRMAGARDVAEDLLQESLMKAHRARASYVLGADPLPWLYAIAHRTFIDHARKNQRARVRVARRDEALPDPVATLTGSRASDDLPGPSPMEERLQSALAQLPVAQRQAVVLTKLEGRSMALAADIAGTTTGAMKVRAHRAYRALRALLGEDATDE